MTSSEVYRISPAHATFLLGLINLPTDEREATMLRLMADLSQETTIKLFAQFIGMANSVVANNREMIELICISEGISFPDRRSSMPNLPDLTGACIGIKNANGVSQDGLCHGCAFRVGTPANQSPITSTDARICASPGEDTFFCHEEETMDAGRPTKPCPGWVRARAIQKKEQRA